MEPMLTITEDALEAIRVLTSQTGASGVRISTSGYSFNGSGPAVQLEPAPGPEGGDQVVDAGGARVFLAPSAAAFAGKVLDAETEAGEVRFRLHEQL
jgi:iron-sulfur cluster assembly protein